MATVKDFIDILFRKTNPITEEERDSYDFDINSEGDFVSDDTLNNPTNVSILTDSRADESEVPEASKRGGWSGNEIYAQIGHEMGSKLHLVKQRRFNEETKNISRDYVKKSLQWLVDDGIVEQVNVDATLIFGNPNRLEIAIDFIGSDLGTLTLTV